MPGHKGFPWGPGMQIPKSKCWFPNPAAQVPNPCQAVPKSRLPAEFPNMGPIQSSQIQVPSKVAKSRPPLRAPKSRFLASSQIRLASRNHFRSSQIQASARSSQIQVPASSNIQLGCESSFSGVPKSSFQNPGRVPESRGEFPNLGSRILSLPFALWGFYTWGCSFSSDRF